MVVVLLLFMVAGVLVASPASADARWLGSDPEETVVMTYGEDIALQIVNTRLVPTGGEPAPSRAATDGSDVAIDVAVAASDVVASGEWQAVTRAVSVDGHPVEHTTKLRLDGAPAAQASVDPTSAQSSEATEPTATRMANVIATSQPLARMSAQPTTATREPVTGAPDSVPGWSVPQLVVGSVIVGGVVLTMLAAATAPYLRRRG